MTGDDRKWTRLEAKREGIVHGRGGGALCGLLMSLSGNMSLLPFT